MLDLSLVSCLLAQMRLESRYQRVRESPTFQRLQYKANRPINSQVYKEIRQYFPMLLILTLQLLIFMELSFKYGCYIKIREFYTFKTFKIDRLEFFMKCFNCFMTHKKCNSIFIPS